ncbi:hypothetical protein DAETH_41780 (plasmid) [Deinococcus aetherius]|uniref:Haloalkane dehalogenase n=1 Tax=Deinococcus aetherius TaxID=200252 RepID=A0ABM8AKF1_9DEIO|nr:hypothetical protein [Deinococcus aetherius]BDP44209.1 hypothetical protein DAETH_41780 [Deinococcus aetherius]
MDDVLRTPDGAFADLPGSHFAPHSLNNPPRAGPVRLLRSVIRGCPPPLKFPHAGHFVQEDAGDEVAHAALEAFGLTRGTG